MASAVLALKARTEVGCAVMVGQVSQDAAQREHLVKWGPLLAAASVGRALCFYLPLWQGCGWVRRAGMQQHHGVHPP